MARSVYTIAVENREIRFLDQSGRRDSRIGVIRRRRRGASDVAVRRGRGRVRLGRVSVGGGSGRGRGLVCRRRVVPRRRNRRRHINGLGTRRVGGKEDAVIVVTISEDAVLSTVTETPLPEADVRKVFGVAESGGLTPGSRGDHIVHWASARTSKRFTHLAATKHARCYARSGTNTLASEHPDCNF